MERIKNEIFLNSLFTFRHENIRFNILLMSSIEVTDFLIEQLNKYYKSYQDAKFIWRDECLFCYDNSKNSSEEYYICLSSYLGFCARHEPTAQIPTQMGIGIEGGFNIQNKNFKEDFYLVVGDTVRGISKINYDPNFLPNDINILINTGYLSMNRCSQVIPWSDSEVTLSKHSENLYQISEPPKLNQKGWKCRDCALETNLWLNLSDGVICCGRSYHDGSGGQNHSYNHFLKTQYPLAVKLTTLDASSAEVYSYEEDKMVRDSKIDQHLNHFGLCRANLTKSEPTILEKEININLNLKLEMKDILEGGGKLQPLFGPGYTGIVNLGNSCYMASLLQVLFSIPEIIQQFSQKEFPYFFIKQTTSFLVTDIYFQMFFNFFLYRCKFCHHLYSGKYSEPAFDENNEPFRSDTGIRPLMLKKALTDSHIEFKTFSQQDVVEFFMFLTEELTSFQNTNQMPTSIENLFHFSITEYFQLQDSSSDVQSRKLTEKILRLSIPFDKVETAIDEQQLSNDKSIKCEVKKLSWENCYEHLCAPTIIDNMTINGKTGPAFCYTRLSSLPDYLVVQFYRFSFDPVTFAPIKLDILFSPPKILDLSLFATNPNFGAVIKPSNQTSPMSDTDRFILSELINMGFDEQFIKKAIIETKSVGVNEALDWVISHQHQNIPVESFSTEISESSIQNLTTMGFTKDISFKALTIKGGNTNQAIDYLLTKFDSLERDYEQHVSKLAAQNIPPIDPSQAKYEMIDFISHIGSSPHTGHYVCHVFKDDQWVIYNDENVAESVFPPFQRGYLYFYRRKKQLI
ncbi:hypothetical protein HZS_3448 [Henneguya salminicola]|nr:hypothetical protein HZS_3448 [Henneguya salminicola]